MGKKLEEHKKKFDFYKQSDEQATICRQLQLANGSHKKQIGELEGENFLLKRANRTQVRTICSKKEQIELKDSIIKELVKKIEDLESRLKHPLPINYVDKHRIKDK